MAAMTDVDGGPESMNAGSGLTANPDGAGSRGDTMKALVQEGYGSADVLHVRDIPKPALVEGRVLVRMRAASVNALDWHTTHGGLLLEIIGKITRQRDEPVRGVDLAGTVEAVGPGVTRFKPGDEVFGSASATFAEYVLAREDRLLLKPPALPFEQAATVNVAGRTALQGLRDHAQVKPGQRVLIHGAGGGVGTFAVQIAKALGAHVTAVTGSRNVETIRSLGADEVIDDTQEDFARRPERFDAVLDIAATRSVSDLRRVLVPNGIFVQVGAAKHGGWIGVFARIINVTVRARVLRQRVTFFVAQLGLDDLAYLTELIAAGRLRPVIDRTYPLADGREAVRYVGTGQARAKVVITA
jgi:NADPH:quinone reductase-like Zn-dependent oxidoreductase